MQKTDDLKQFFFLTIHPGFGFPLFNTVYQVARILHNNAKLDKKHFGILFRTQARILEGVIKNPYVFLNQERALVLQEIVLIHLDSFNIASDKKEEIIKTLNEIMAKSIVK